MRFNLLISSVLFSFRYCWAWSLCASWPVALQPTCCVARWNRSSTLTWRRRSTTTMSRAMAAWRRRGTSCRYCLDSGFFPKESYCFFLRLNLLEPSLIHDLWVGLERSLLSVRLLSVTGLACLRGCGTEVQLTVVSLRHGCALYPLTDQRVKHLFYFW